MNFLATVAILSVAAINTAKLEFSNITEKSDSTFCNPPECSGYLYKGSSELFSKTEFQKCLESVSAYCRYTATVHLTGELNEFCVHSVRGNVVSVTNVTDIKPQWGSLAKDPEFRGSVKLKMTGKSGLDCRFQGLFWKLPIKCEADYFNDFEEPKFHISSSSFHLADLQKKHDEAVFGPELFVRRLHEPKYDGLIVFRPKILEGPCVGTLQSIVFSKVSWIAKFEGFNPTIWSASSATIDATSAIVSAAIVCAVWS